MSDYYIGLSGLAAAKRAFDVIGNNIANAATEGYHRQRLELSPAFASQPNTPTFIGGVNVDGVTRMIDTLLEMEILRQKSMQGAISQEASTLSTIEAAFGDFASQKGGLNAAMDAFFISLQNLSAHPTENIWQNQVVGDAEAMVSQFRMLGQFLDTSKGHIKLEAENTVAAVNLLVEQIAGLNDKIERVRLVSGDAGSMSDQRDRFLSQLSELIEVQTVNHKNGIVDVSASGIPLVTGAMKNRIEVGFDSDGKMGLSIEGANIYNTNIQGGKMGGLRSLNNELVSGIQSDLDALANALMREVNHYQVMGIGSAGSFTELTGKPLLSEQLSDIGDITNGTLYIRVTNTAANTITRTPITINTGDTLSDVAASISAITGLTATVGSSNRLVLSAGTNYTFDFLPCALPEPTQVDFDDASPPAVSVTGIYTGTRNDTFTCTVKGDGVVGNGTLELEVRNSDNELVKTLNIGSGYAAGDLLAIGNGIKMALSAGNLAESDGDVFEIDALADTDTSGFLEAVGINTFFSGNSAATMAVSSAISQDPHRVAASLNADGNDGGNVLRMAAIKDKAIGSLGSLTCGDFYREMSVNLGQELSIKQMQRENVEAVMLDLNNQRDLVSGVDINDEAAQLLIFQQMFQAMAKYLSVLDASVSNLMDIL